MQRVCVLLGVVAVAFAAPQKPDAEIAIVKQDFDQQPDGSYRYRSVANGRYAYAKIRMRSALCLHKLPVEVGTLRKPIAACGMVVTNDFG